jgi:deoxyadenosine/deoxycytidine kinase
MTMATIDVSIEANIGAGKSTLLRELKKRFPATIHIIGEPLDEWQTMIDESKGNKNILELFYNDIPEYGFSFQMNALKTRIEKNNQEKVGNKINVVERSIISDHYIFAKKLKDEGKMNLIEWKVYEEWYKWLVEAFDVMPKSMIYLRCSPEIAYERVKKRNRSEEESISLEYLKSLHQYHEELLIGNPSLNVKIIDVNEDFEENDERIGEIFKEIFSGGGAVQSV